MGASGAAVVGLAGCSESVQGVAAGDKAADADAREQAALRRVDPRLLLYRETSRVRTGMAQARGIALGADGTLYVAGDRAIAAFGADGSRRAEFAIPAEPTCVAAAPAGGLFVGCTDRIEVRDAAGALSAAWPSFGERAMITGIAASRDALWVADSGNRVAVGYDHTGREIGRVGRKDAATGYPGLILPSPHLQVRILPNGNLAVNNPGNHAVETHTPGGRLVSAWGTASSDLKAFCGCCNPTSIAVLPDGRVITAEKGLPRVKVYTAAGVFQGVVAGPDDFAPNVTSLDLAAGASGSIYVLDPAASEVRIYVARS